jgi:multiple sugar transport system substrate-binding protein
MRGVTRRSLIRGSAGLVAAGAMARPYLGNAAATTATAWWVQGFAEEEDISFKKIVADYQKASGNTIDYSIMPYAPLRQKIVSAVSSGVVPDLIQNNPYEILALFAWNDQLADVSDIVETQKAQYNETALLTAYCYNSIEKRRRFYGVPYTARCGQTISGGRWSRRPGTRWKTCREPGMPSSISSRRCRRSCVPRASARFLLSASR